MSRSCDYAQRSFFLSIFPTTLHTRKNSFFDPLTCSILVFGPVSSQNFVWYIDFYFSAILVQLLILRFFFSDKFRSSALYNSGYDGFDYR